MPVGPCESNGRPGYRCGQEGKCYTYTPGDAASRKQAKQKAIDQCLAMGEEPSADTETAAPTADELNRLLARAERHAENVEPLLEAAVADVLTEIAATAARRFAATATDYALTAAAPGVTAQSTMVALKPTAEQAAALALDDGEPAANLHVTLAYLGETTGPLNLVVDALRPVAMRHAALAGVVGGAGSFDDYGDGFPALALPDVPGLVELRVAVTEALTSAGIEYARNHGFTAHVTLAYRPAPAFMVEAIGVPLSFGELLIVRGDTEIIELPLSGRPPLTAAAERVARHVERIWGIDSAGLDDVERQIAVVAEKHQPDEPAYGQAYYNAETRTVFWVAWDGTSIEEENAARDDFLAIDGVDEFETCWECAGPANEDHYGPGWSRVYAARWATLAEATAEPFRQSLAAAAGDPPPWGIPVADEIIDVDELIARITTRTKPVRDAAVAAAATPVLDAVGLSFDVTNPLVGQVLAQAGSQVVDIAATTQLNVMRIVRASYEAGLSIPHTAEAIREGMAEATPARARLIARTELVGAVNGGSLAAVRLVEGATGIAYRKTWMTAPGAKHPRHHLYDGLNGQTVPLAGKFSVGGAELDHPGDPEGPPREICNCRCTMKYAEPDA